MTKTSHLFWSVTFLIAVMNVTIINSAMTIKQMSIAGKMMRESCQNDLSDELIDGLKIGQYPDNDDLRCYVNCIMELLLFVRNGVLNIDFAVKQMKKLLPEELREPYTHAANACRTAADGIKEKCRVAYALLECFYHNEPDFIFP